MYWSDYIYNIYFYIYMVWWCSSTYLISQRRKSILAWSRRSKSVLAGIRYSPEWDVQQHAFQTRERMRKHPGKDTSLTICFHNTLFEKLRRVESLLRSFLNQSFGGLWRRLHTFNKSTKYRHQGLELAPLQALYRVSLFLDFNHLFAIWDLFGK